MRTSSLYGRITSLSEGSLYIDVDTDSHSVVSLEGKEDVPREYMMSTGIMGSAYESIIWEQITGHESVSTISILAQAKQEEIGILVISSTNLNEEIEKLNTDEATRQTVINAVNSGKVVTIPAEEVTMGDWHGTGYIITNPKTGTGAYMISGGLNGGSTKFILGIEELLTTVGSAVVLAGLIVALVGALSGFWFVACVALLLAAWFVISYLMWTNYMEYAFNDNLEAKEISKAEMAILMIYTIMLQLVVIPSVPPENKEPEVEEGGSGKLTGSLDGLTADERAMVNDLLNQGKNVEIIPRDNNQKTPDFYVDGVRTELKTLNGSSLNTPVTRIQDGFKQGAETVIIDARKTGMTLEEAQTVIDRVVGIYNGELPGNIEIWTQEGVLKY